jgi:PKD repeat protein
MKRLFFFSLIIIFSLFSTSCNQHNDPLPVTITADFTANQLVVEEGDSIDFTDLSTGDPTSWTWTFEGGEPAISTEQSPAVTYSVAGTYGVSLTVASENAEGTETKAGYITVNEKPVPFQELYDQGIDKYLGVFTPASSNEVMPGLTEHVLPGLMGQFALPATNSPCLQERAAATTC